MHLCRKPKDLGRKRHGTTQKAWPAGLDMGSAACRFLPFRHRVGVGGAGIQDGLRRKARASPHCLDISELIPVNGQHTPPISRELAQTPSVQPSRPQRTREDLGRVVSAAAPADLREAPNSRGEGSVPLQPRTCSAQVRRQSSKDAGGPAWGHGSGEADRDSWCSGSPFGSTGRCTCPESPDPEPSPHIPPACAAWPPHHWPPSPESTQSSWHTLGTSQPRKERASTVTQDTKGRPSSLELRMSRHVP